ncbi:FDXHR family putative zinc-binding protein [Pandoraea pnomenusa]|uniref:FDXHR family putative zinc-binding protein n=1 Tax=Pandoraea pnomenusa TaxID=93220 RepID=UPI0005211BC2
MSKRLTGDRNQCPGCHQHFNSSHAFDKHRIGVFGKDRRCMTVPEMKAKGMAINKDGFWVSSLRPQESILRAPVGT